MAGHYLGGMHTELVVRRDEPRGDAFRPFAARGRRTVVAILVMFALVLGGQRHALDPGDRRARSTGPRSSRSRRGSARSPSATSRRSCSSRAGAQADPADTADAPARRAPTCCSTAATRRRSTATTTRPMLAAGDRHDRPRAARAGAPARRRPHRDRERVPRGPAGRPRSADRGRARQRRPTRSQRLRVLAGAHLERRR